MTYDDFLVAFEEGRSDQYALPPKDVQYPQPVNSDLDLDPIKQKIRIKMADKLDVLQKVQIEWFAKSNNCTSSILEVFM